MKHEVFLALISLWIIFNHDYLNKYISTEYLASFTINYLGEKLMITHFSILTALIY